MSTQQQEIPRGFGARIQRAFLLALMAVVAINIWTGAPLLAVWVGSRIQGDSQVSMTAVFGVIAVLVITAAALIKLLGVLGARHDALSGRTRAQRRQQPWLRSLSGERLADQRKRAPVSALDVMLVATVVLAAAAFEIWFFFFSGSSI